MKTFTQTPKLVLSFEKDDKKNKTGMQMRAWFINNGTTIIVRLFKHDSLATEKLWNGKRTHGDVREVILNELHVNSLIKNTDNWEYDGVIVGKVQTQDEFEEKQNCIYFTWSVKKNLLLRF